jgi:hypothetical protein
MHYLYTPNILLAFSVLISFKQFGGRPLECMFPNKFPGSWEQVNIFIPQSGTKMAKSTLSRAQLYAIDQIGMY